MTFERKCELQAYANNYREVSETRAKNQAEDLADREREKRLSCYYCIHYDAFLPKRCSCSDSCYGRRRFVLDRSKAEE